MRNIFNKIALNVRIVIAGWLAQEGRSNFIGESTMYILPTISFKRIFISKFHIIFSPSCLNALSTFYSIIASASSDRILNWNLQPSLTYFQILFSYFELHKREIIACHRMKGRLETSTSLTVHIRSDSSVWEPRHKLHPPSMKANSFERVDQWIRQVYVYLRSLTSLWKRLLHVE